MSTSGYVCAGFESLGEILDSFMRDDSFDNHFARLDLNNFFASTCNKFLHSFGTSFGGKKAYLKHAEQEANLLKRCRDYKFFDSSIFIVDSGGFQASIGLLDKTETELLQDIYYDDFLVNYKDVYDRAFVLDIPPGPGCKIFESFDDVYKMNLKSYIKAAELPDNVREKMVYIHHFRTPKLWKIYTKILDENDLFDKFKYHATGGIVANMASDTSIPCIIYVLPLIPLINRAKKFGRKELHFHILGGANYRDLLFYELFKLHVKKVHDLDLEITYDSSGIFKGLMIGRIFPILDNGVVKRIDLRSSILDMRYDRKRSIIDMYKESLQELCKFGFKDINLQLDNVYSDETGTFFTPVRSYSMLAMLYLYSKVQDFLKGEVGKLYQLYESENLIEFNKEALNITCNMNDGKITKKQKSKSTSISKSLDMLTDLNEEFCEFIVTKNLQKDEFAGLEGKCVGTIFQKEMLC